MVVGVGLAVAEDANLAEILERIGWTGIDRDGNRERLRNAARELRRRRNELWDMAAGQVQQRETVNCLSWRVEGLKAWT